MAPPGGQAIKSPRGRRTPPAVCVTQWPHSACAWGHALPPDAKAREPRRTQLGGRGRGTMPGEGAPETLSLKTNLLQQTCAQPLTDMTHMRIRCTHTATQRTHVYNHLHMPAHTCTTSLLHATTYLHTHHTQCLGLLGGESFLSRLWGTTSQQSRGGRSQACPLGQRPRESPATLPHPGSLRAAVLHALASGSSLCHVLLRPYKQVWELLPAWVPWSPPRAAQPPCCQGARFPQDTCWLRSLVATGH